MIRYPCPDHKFPSCLVAMCKQEGPQRQLLALRLSWIRHPHQRVCLTSPILAGMPVPPGGRFPVTVVPGMMDQPPSRSALIALRPQEVGTAPTADTSSAPRPVAAPVPAPTPAPQPAITPEAIAGDISQSAASAERPSFNPLDFTMIGMAKRLIDSLAGGGGSG
jgi:hypothetical protein